MFEKIKNAAMLLLTCILINGCSEQVEPTIINLKLDLSTSITNISFENGSLVVNSEGVSEGLTLELSDVENQNFETDKLSVLYGDETAKQWCTVTLVDKSLIITVEDYDNKEKERDVEITIKSDDENIISTKFTIVQTPLPKLKDAKILSFSFEEEASPAIINNDDNTILIKVKSQTDISSLNPIIGISERATIVPNSDEAQDFTSIVQYTVTSEDEKIVTEYSVEVSIAYGPDANKAEILTFSLPNQMGDAIIDHEAKTVSVDILNGTDLTSMTPEITITDFATITPDGTVASDFTEAVEYTITSEDKTTTNIYTATVTTKLNPEAKLNSFVVGDPESEGLVVEGVIDEANKTVVFNLPYSDKWPFGYAPAYTATVSSGAKAVMAFNSWDSSFESGASYAITSEDALTTETYTISHIMAPNPDAYLLGLTFYDPVTNGQPDGIYSISIDNETKAVVVKIKEGANISNLHVKVICSSGSTTDFVEGSTIDLTSGSTISVTSEDGSLTNEYNISTSYVNISDYELEMISVETNTKFVFGGNSLEAYVQDYAQDVTLTIDYSIGKYEIRQDIFEELMGINTSPNIGDNYPISNINWYEAAEFCNRLSILCGLTPVYNFENVKYSTYDNRIISAIVTYNHTSSAKGYRLPTNAEFEFAAKGGNMSENYPFAGSENSKDVAWYKDNTSMYDNKPQTVGGKLPNELGIYDMSGNVDEWVYDWELSFPYGSMPDYADVDPVGGIAPVGAPTWEDYKVFRGGATTSAISVISVGYFRSSGAESKSPDRGFRIALSK